MTETMNAQQTSTPSRPAGRRHAKSSPHAQTAQSEPRRKNNGFKGKRPGNGQPQGGQQPLPRQESALTKKFREAASDNAVNSDSGVNAIVNRGLVTPPATPGPQRNVPVSYVSDSALGTSTNTANNQNKKRNRRRGKKPADINTHPIPQAITPPQEELHTPPEDNMFDKQPTPLKKYAGACFHASPAPNALPLPKFFSKSVPSSSDGPSLSQMVAEAEAAGIPDASVESPPKTAPIISGGTPLDIFFKADRREKAEKARKALEFGDDNVRPAGVLTPGRDINLNARRNITPPSAPAQTTLGSPFGGDKTLSREDSDSSDLLFSMDVPETKKPRSAEEVVIGQRFRPLSAQAYDAETLVKRQEKAKALKAALMNKQQNPMNSKMTDLEGPPSPSPKPKARPQPPASENEQPLSPTLYERRAVGNVGFAPAPRIRHFNQNRPVARHPHNNRPGKAATIPMSPVQYDQARNLAAESFVRGVLKLDSPIPAN